MSTKKNNKRGITRRDFIKWSAAAGAAGTAVDWSVVGPKAYADSQSAAHTHKSICPYCSVGCGMTVATNAAGTEVTDIYGDSDHVISRGALCSKGSAAYQLVNSKQRIGISDSAVGITGPMVRIGNGPWQAPNPADKWDAILGTDTFIAGIYSNVPGVAKALKDTRGDLTSVTDDTPGDKKVAWLGCSYMTVEDNYVYRKLILNFYSNNVEHQARL
jgi:formate dehydrogenase major subunit